MESDAFGKLIQAGDAESVREALRADPGLADGTVTWYLNQENRSDPLHFVCDCVAENLIDGDKAAGLARILLDHGASVDGANGRETPLLGATSLGAERVANLLIEAGADIAATSIFGAGPLHWAAYVGLPSTVDLLVVRGVDIEAKCTEFGATPLFWAVHGFGPRGPDNAEGQLAAASALIRAGAIIDTANKDGLTAIDCARRAQSGAMHELLVCQSRS